MQLFVVLSLLALVLILTAIPSLTAVASVNVDPAKSTVARRCRGAIYARYSTRYQDSIQDQVAKCREWAENNEVDVDEALIFFDKEITGRTDRRPGLQAMLEALRQDKIDVLIVFATNRLYRKLYRTVQFVEEEIVPVRKRAVFVSQNIDSAKTDHWRLLLTVISASDELQVQSLAPHVRAAHQSINARRLVTTTLPFGYCGVAIETGEKTKRGLARQRIEIDNNAAVWVRRIFQWFGVDGLGIADILRRLQSTPDVPPPPKSKNGHWTYLALRILLSNRRYIGDFSYGLKEAVFLPKQGYTRQIQRAQPLSVQEFPELGIVDRELFEAVQVRLARYRDRVGNRKRRNSDLLRPSILKGILKCAVHLCPLASNGRAFYCRKCKTDPGPASLFSLLPEKVAVSLLMSKLAEVIRSNDRWVCQIRDHVVAAAEAAQQVNPEQVAAQRNEIELLTAQIHRVALFPVGSSVDRRENDDLVAQLRARRATLQRAASSAEAVSRRIHVPTEAEISAQLASLAELLTRAAKGELDDDGYARARRVVLAMTGGEVFLRQAGEPRAKRGWLRGTFALNIVEPVLLDTQSPEVAENAATSQVALDFRLPAALDQLAEKVNAMSEAGLLLCEIAAELHIAKSRVTKAIAHYYRSRGLPIPDGRTRRSTLSRKHREPPLYQRISSRVHDLVKSGQHLGPISRLLDVDRNTVTQALYFWHRTNGVPVPPGKGRRRTPSGPPSASDPVGA